MPLIDQRRLGRVSDTIRQLSTSILLRRKGGRLASLVNVNVPVTRHGRRLIIPLMGGVGFDNLVVSERWMEVILPALLPRKPALFVDVGANVGQTLLKVKTLRPETEYLGCEPNPTCFNYTRALIAANALTGCRLLPVGLSNVTRVLPLFARSVADVSASVVEGFRPIARSPHLMDVTVFEGDDLFESLGRPRIGVLKVDVEGGELEVLQGLKGTIEQNRPFILCEILPLFSTTSERGRFRAARQEALLAFMRAARYAMYRILENAALVPLEGIDCHSDMSLTNYLFAPEEDRAYLQTTLGARAADVAPLL